jgi:hypothetical protein
MTFKNNLRFIFWNLIWFLFPLILFVSVTTSNYFKTGNFNIQKIFPVSAIIFGIMALIFIPGFLLHYRYYKQDKNKSIRFRPTYFLLNDLDEIHKIYFSDILKIEKHHVLWNGRIPWNNYGYIRIILRGGQLFSFNCLTHDIISSTILFKNKNILVEDFEELYPW